MNEQIQIDMNELFLEIARYLAAVDLYRVESCEPTWLPESAPSLGPADTKGISLPTKVNG